jgi:hypothetical protein
VPSATSPRLSSSVKSLKMSGTCAV